MSDKIREEFEVWAATEGIKTKSSEGFYFSALTREIWKAWQAAYKASRHDELVAAYKILRSCVNRYATKDPEITDASYTLSLPEIKALDELLKGN